MGVSASDLTVSSPPKPAPTTTTRWRRSSAGEGSVVAREVRAGMVDAVRVGESADTMTSWDRDWTNYITHRFNAVTDGTHPVRRGRYDLGLASTHGSAPR